MQTDSVGVDKLFEAAESYPVADKSGSHVGDIRKTYILVVVTANVV